MPIYQKDLTFGINKDGVGYDLWMKESVEKLLDMGLSKSDSDDPAGRGCYIDENLSLSVRVVRKCIIY